MHSIFASCLQTFHILDVRLFHNHIYEILRENNQYENSPIEIQITNHMVEIMELQCVEALMKMCYKQGLDRTLELHYASTYFIVIFSGGTCVVLVGH